MYSRKSVLRSVFHLFSRLLPLLVLLTSGAGGGSLVWSQVPAGVDRQEIEKGKPEIQPVQLVLWGDQIPGLAEGEKPEIISEQDARIGEKVTRVTRPMISVYAPPPEKNNGAAVIICPGGGYHILAYDLEGTEVARWLNQLGVTGIVLHYRVPRSKDRPKHELPLMDLQRAIRVVRGHAADWGIDPRRLGVLGFSAGGHLAAAASTRYEKSNYEPVDAADELSCRPDFSVLVYPGYLNREGTLELQEELIVDARTPPAILIHTSDDNVSSLGSVAYYAALKQAGVPAALHIFPAGGHGYGLRPSQDAVSGWPELVAGFLKAKGFLTK